MIMLLVGSGKPPDKFWGPLLFTSYPEVIVFYRPVIDPNIERIGGEDARQLVVANPLLGHLNARKYAPSEAPTGCVKNPKILFVIF